MPPVEVIHQESSESTLTRSFNRLLESDALISALMQKISAQSLRPQVVPVEGMSCGKCENKVGKDKHLVVLFSHTDADSSSKVLDANSDVYDKRKVRTTRKARKRRFRQKRRKSYKYDLSSSAFPAPDTKTKNTSLDSCEEVCTSKTEHGHRNRTKKNSGDRRDVV